MNALLFQPYLQSFIEFFSVALKSDDEQDAGSSLKNINKKTLWVILMTGGGHFVGAIFQG